MRYQSIIYLLISILFFSSCTEDVPEPGGVLITDSRDNQSYLTITIGNQNWMAENLQYRANNSSVCYNNSSGNCDLYGRLYTFKEATDACPSGWHLPSEEEYQELELTLGMASDKVDNNGWRGSDQGYQMKEGGGSGFRVNMGGFQVDQIFAELGNKTGFWSATSDASNPEFAIGRELGISDKKVRRVGLKKLDRYSIRCIED